MVKDRWRRKNMKKNNERVKGHLPCAPVTATPAKTARLGNPGSVSWIDTGATTGTYDGKLRAGRCETPTAATTAVPTAAVAISAEIGFGGFGPGEGRFVFRPVLPTQLVDGFPHVGWWWCRRGHQRRCPGQVRRRRFGLVHRRCQAFVALTEADFCPLAADWLLRFGCHLLTSEQTKYHGHTCISSHRAHRSPPRPFVCMVLQWVPSVWPYL